ncbi:MAG: TolC family protein [Acidobacteria bacterium]|nr:TolC family protein [Acidobacteriota bacterium]MBI3422071.1 TolC family protein [Acidobacteriota bacterium]
MKRKNCFRLSAALLWLNCAAALALGQVASVPVESAPAPASAAPISVYARLIDPAKGMTADDLVRYALEHNGELLAARRMIAEAQGRLRQAGLKANPMLETSGKQAVTTPDNNQMFSVELPLELGGRRQARVLVGQREVEMRQAEVRDFERKLAAEVRMKYADAIATARKLKLTEELLESTRNSHQLVQARVEHGKSAVLEKNEVWVELNRADAARLNVESKAEIALLELKKVIGAPPEEQLELRGEFAAVQPAPAAAELLKQALAMRPDLMTLRAAERLAEAQIEQVRREGRIEASVFAGYERMSNGYDVLGFNEAGRLTPVNAVFHYATFGVRFTLPTRNKNQGMIEAAVAAAEAARHRREFAELVVRNEVASVTARLERARAALAVYRERVLAPAQQNLDVVQKTYTLGYKTALDYLTEQRRYIEVENDYTEALKEYLEALAELDRVAGVTLREEKQ